MERFFSPRDVAAAIGVSESSLKRWADEGLLHVSRTAGGHRRIALREVLRYLRQTGTPLVRPEVIGLPENSSTVSPGSGADREEVFIDSILRGDLEATRGALVARYLAGESVASLCDGPLRTALHRVGELWHHGPEGIHIEHRASDACIHALNYLRGLLPSPSGSSLLGLGGAPAKDFYLIPSLMTSVVLESEGWRSINLGANLPGVALVSAIRQYQPRLVWISCSTHEVAEGALRDLHEAIELAGTTGASFVAGGQALSPRAKSLPASVVILPSMEALAGFARGIASSRES